MYAITKEQTDRQTDKQSLSYMERASETETSDNQTRVSTPRLSRACKFRLIILNVY